MRVNKVRGPDGVVHLVAGSNRYTVCEWRHNEWIRPRIQKYGVEARGPVTCVVCLATREDDAET